MQADKDDSAENHLEASVLYRQAKVCAGKQVTLAVLVNKRMRLVPKFTLNFSI